MTENAAWLRRDARRARKEGPEGFARRQRDRLRDMIAYARANSPYYRERYRDLPDGIDDPTRLPVTSKAELTARFDDWVTDREIHLEDVTAFVDDLTKIGDRFLGRYLVATTSGTTGKRGIFVLDDRYLNVAAAIGARAYLDALGVGGLLRVVARGGRVAPVGATGGHFVSYAGYIRTTRDSAWRRRIIRPFSVHTPMPELVAEFNRFRPGVLVGYASMITLLAAEQEAGRLHIHPVLVQPAGETFTEGDRERVAKAFDTKVRTIYGATECTYLSYGCEHGWHHVNTDWAVLEPVDADHRPTPPGEWSHTVLISNLANRVQPFLRYDLGDSVRLRPDPCPCGNRLPAVQVQGRAGDVLTFPTERGDQVSLAPLTFGTLLDRTPGVDLFQIVQTEPDTLRVRLRLADGADPDQVWRAAHRELTDLLADQKLENVTVERAEEPPKQAPGGKYRSVIPLR
jgi:phenylacetate-coenzyme A ligase PaaK-like adenylate-forming protein